MHSVFMNRLGCVSSEVMVFQKWITTLSKLIDPEKHHTGFSFFRIYTRDLRRRLHSSIKKKMPSCILAVLMPMPAYLR